MNIKYRYHSHSVIGDTQDAVKFVNTHRPNWDVMTFQQIRPLYTIITYRTILEERS
ncbi:MAG: hypothetical protein KAJ73_00165 [Zetaproteobacteria bacterium]|nr:hypothetical protein [Zetaproteobacteria bacterium]